MDTVIPANRRGMAPCIVTVIIPTYNSAGTVADMVRDMLGQSFEDFELVCVDDGSTDGTLDVIRDATAGDERIVMAQQRHSGVAAARNLGLSLASGTYVCFIDSDDRLDSNYLEAMIERMDADGSDMACCGWDRGNGTEARSFGGKVVYQGFGSLEALLDDVFFSRLWNRMFDRAFLSPTGLWSLSTNRSQSARTRSGFRMCFKDVAAAPSSISLPITGHVARAA